MTSHVFAFGDNSRGQLMLGSGAARCPTPTRIERLASQRISTVACGPDSSFAVSAQGDVWGGGDNEQGQVSIDEKCKGTTSIGKILRIESLENCVVRLMSSGGSHTVAVLESGTAVSFGANEFGQLGHGDVELDLKPRPPRILAGISTNIPICYVACGSSHSLALTKAGQLFAVGNNTFGCLGLSKECNESTMICRSFQQIPTLVGCPIQQVVSGRHHSLAMTLSGAVFVWGRNKAGQLGIDQTPVPSFPVDVVPVPTKVETVPRARQVAAGADSSVIIGTASSVFVCGLNDFGQLGLDPDVAKCIRQFTRVDVIAEVVGKVAMVSCGRQHMLVVGKNGSLFAMGSNADGQLGLGEGQLGLEMTFRPLPVMVAPELFFYDAAAGDAHSLVCGVPREILGVNSLGRCEAGELLGTSRVIGSDLMDSKSLRRHGTLGSEDPLGTLTSIVSTSFEVLRRTGQLMQITPGAVAKRLEAVDLTRKDTTVFKAGISVLDGLSLIESARSRSDTRELREFISPIFRTVSRLNCSFLRKGRVARLDIDGVQSFYQELVNLESTIKCDDLFTEMLNAFDVCLKSCEGVESHLCESDQVRFLLIILQSPIFISHKTAVTRVLTRLCSTIARLSAAGKRNLISILVEDCPMIIFSNNYVTHLKTLISTELPGTEDVSQNQRIWDAVLALQVFYVASLDITSSSRIGDVGSLVPTGGSLAPETFHLTEIDLTLGNVGAAREVGRYHDTHADHFDPMMSISTTSLPANERLFVSHFNLCPIKYKKTVITADMVWRQTRICQKSIRQQSCPFFILRVRRSSAVSDALAQMVSDSELFKPLKVIFVGEEGVDEGGLKREFFSLVCKTLFDQNYGMFTYCTETRIVWFKRNCLEDTYREFFFVGCLIGLAIYNDIMLDCQLPLALYKKIQGIDVGLADLSEIDPDQARSFQQLLDWPASDGPGFEAAFGSTTFEVVDDFFGTARTFELKPGGSDVPLTMDSRREFVELYVEWLLVGSVEQQAREFLRGFKLFRTDFVDNVTPQELHLLVSGTPVLDFNSLRQGTRYEGYSARESYINQFWEILIDELDTEQKKSFLRFSTGGDRVPVGGLQELRLLIQKNGEEPTAKLPTAHTCFNALLLPRYASKAKLRRMVVTAIENSEGFGLK